MVNIKKQLSNHKREKIRYLSRDRIKNTSNRCIILLNIILINNTSRVRFI